MHMGLLSFRFWLASCSSPTVRPKLVNSKLNPKPDAYMTYGLNVDWGDLLGTVSGFGGDLVRDKLQI